MNNSTDPKKGIHKFFQTLYGNNSSDGYLVIWTKQDKVSTFYKCDEFEKASVDAEYQSNHSDVYFGVGLQQEKPLNGGRGTADTVISIPGLWLDIDVKGPNHRSDNLPPDQESARKLLESFKLEPTLIISTGGGFHVYWLFDEPMTLNNGKERNKAKKLSKRFQKVFINLAATHGWEIDNTSDLSRVLRLPGTFNHKQADHPVPVSLIMQSDNNRYSLEDIEAALNDCDVPDIYPLQPYTGEMIPAGKRNSSLTSIAGSLRAKGFNEEELEKALIKKNLSCNPPLPKEEVMSIVKSICRYPKGTFGQVAVIPSTNNCQLTDLGNAERFVDQHIGHIRYNSKWKKWIVWDGKRWTAEFEALIKRKAIETIKSMYLEALGIEHEEDRRKLTQHALYSEREARINGIIKLAMVQPGIPVQPEALDSDPMLLNCLNGTVDLQTGELLEHNRNHLITKIAQVKYDPNAECPTWSLFLNKIMNENQNLISYLQRMVGYCLTGLTKEQCMFIFHGTGANGKSTFIETVRTMLGDYAKQTDFNTFKKSKFDSIRNDVARIKGARFVSAVESGIKDHLDEVLIKQLTGEDMIAARFLHKEFFEFKNTAKIIVAANYKPKITGTDYGIWRRIKLVPFQVTIPEREQDHSLMDKLMDELSGILTWAVKGCLEWHDNKLNHPSEVSDAVQSYQLEMDSVDTFIKECCTKDPDTKEKKTVVYDKYNSWCWDKGIKPESKKDFSTTLIQRGFYQRKSSEWYYIGIALKV